MRLWGKETDKIKKPAYEDLETCCAQQKKRISDMAGVIAQYNKNRRQEHENHIVNEAEGSNRELPYVVLDEDGWIVASTPTFREIFGYDEIHRIRYSAVLRAPEPNGNAENWVRLTAFLQDFESDGLEAIMFDGKRKPRNVHLEKQKPDVIQCIEYDKFGNRSSYALTYRRIDVHDIGFWKKYKKSQRKGKAKSINDYFAILKLNEIEIENKEFLKAMEYYKDHLLKRGLTANKVIKVWNKLRKGQRTYENFKRGCTELILEQRKNEKIKKEKRNRKEKEN